MQAMEIIAKVTNDHKIILNLPESIKDETVKVIVMYNNKEQILPEKKQRQFGQFKEPFFIADDFDKELPDSFWAGKEA